MDNDFNYKPQQPASQPEPDEPADGELEPETSEPQETAPASKVVTSKGGSGGFKKFLGFLGVLILLAAAAGGVYYWQQSRVKGLQTSQTSLQGQVSSLKSQLAKQDAAQPEPKQNPNAAPTTPSADTFDVITGAPGKLTANEADVTVSYSLKNKPTEVWIESGTQPDKLTTVSAHKKPSGQGSGDYGAEGFGITGLKAGTVYYYRAAGTVSGKTIYGGVVTFTTPNATL